MALQAGLTDFAEKYGPIPGRNFSGLTPASPAFPQPKTKELRLRSLARDAYQRQTLAGFTARDLVNLDVITSRKLKEANLQNGILPIMARDRWETRPPSPSWKRNYLYPMKDGTGFWTVDNPEVWAVLEPCLKLASRHLMAMNCLPWFDALINGDRRPIPQYRAQLGESVEGLFSYHVPPVNTPEATRVIRDEIFESLRVKWDLRWYFLSPYEMPDGSAQDIRHRAVGVTCTNIEEVVGGYGRSDWVIGIFIEYERLESLMRDDLSSSDRLLVEWELSDTIVHEIMHAIQKSLFTNPFNVREPYFEQNAISEVGFDFQFYVFGGKAMQIFHRMGYVTPGYFYSTSYPTIRGINWCSVGTIPLTNPGPIDREVKFPIPVTFYQDLQQEEFWAVGVRMFGFPLLHYRSVREGSRMNYQYHYNFISKKYEYSIISRDVRISGIQPLHAPSDTFRSKVQVLETMINMTPYQRAARNFGQDIVKSSREEEAFWINHAAQDAAVRRLFTEAARPGSTEEERAELVVNMTRSIQVAAYHHQFMVISTVSTEQGGGALDTERRDRLLAWNKGSRQFIFELISCCDPNADDDNIRKLEDVLVGLELCRMKLYSPLHGPHDSSDYDEFGEIIFAKQTPLLCRPICNKILGDDSSSMFARCCAGIMVCALDANVEEGWQDRRNQLDKYITMLNRFKSPNLQDWIPPLTEWEVYAIEGRNKQS